MVTEADILLLKSRINELEDRLNFLYQRLGIEYANPNSDPVRSPQIQEAVARAEGRLGSSGRIVLRPSGTEPVIRVMVEGSDDKLVREIAKELAASVASAAKAA